MEDKYVIVEFRSKTGATLCSVIKESELYNYKNERILSITPTTKKHYENVKYPGKSKIDEYMKGRK